MLTGRKYRLAFTPEQAEFADTIGTICRSVWNTALEQRREYRRRGVWMNYVAQAGELADAKTEHEWLKAAPSHVLQQTLMDLDRACREHGTFKVRWRSGRRWNPSFRFPPREADHCGTAREAVGRGEVTEAGLGAVPLVPRPRRASPVGNSVARWEALVRVVPR